MYYNKTKSNFQKRQENNQEFWEKRDEKNEFQILTGQALNLALQKAPELALNELVGVAKDFFGILLVLRQDEGLKHQFWAYKNPLPKDEEELPTIKI